VLLQKLLLYSMIQHFCPSSSFPVVDLIQMLKKTRVPILLDVFVSTVKPELN
jgi:hypothetical protein